MWSPPALQGSWIVDSRRELDLHPLAELSIGNYWPLHVSWCSNTLTKSPPSIKLRSEVCRIDGWIDLKQPRNFEGKHSHFYFSSSFLSFIFCSFFLLSFLYFSSVFLLVRTFYLLCAFIFIIFFLCFFPYIFSVVQAVDLITNWTQHAIIYREKHSMLITSAWSCVDFHMFYFFRGHLLLTELF